MLYLKRKIGQKIIIEGDIEMEIVELSGGQVKLGFNFPDGRSILREEILTRAKTNGDEADLYSKGLL